MNRQEVEERTVLLALSGSHGYGLATPQSDTDYRGIFIATAPYYLGFLTVEQLDRGFVEGQGRFPYLSKDTCIFELRKYINLAANCNPNAMELLFYRDYLYLTPVGELLVAHRELFLSTRVKHSYSGYAYAQIKRVESHRKWLLDPPAHEPEPAEYGLEREDSLTPSEFGAFLEYLYLLVKDRIQFLDEASELYKVIHFTDWKGLLKQYPLPEEAFAYTQKVVQSSDEFMRVLKANQRYRAARHHWDAYSDWKRNRNPKRAELEAKIGYDAKHVTQCIRLLRVGIEILEGKGVIVDRREAGDAEELLAIKRGDYSYEQVMAIANDLYERLDDAYKHSRLPRSVDREAVNDLCMQAVLKQGW